MVSDLNIFAQKWCKVAAAKKVFTNFRRLLTLFKGLFAPTSPSRMSNNFRDSESLGKSNGKKWCQIWKLFLMKGVKSPRRKKFFTDFFSICYFRLNVFLPPLPEVGCPIFLEIWNSWGKVMERSGLTFEHFCLEMI